jgi:hypothetical protein
MSSCLALTALPTSLAGLRWLATCRLALGARRFMTIVVRRLLEGGSWLRWGVGVVLVFLFLVLSGWGVFIYS